MDGNQDGTDEQTNLSLSPWKKNSSTSLPFLLALPAAVFLCLQGMNNVPARAMYRQTSPSVSHIMHEITSSQRHSAQTRSALVQLPPQFGSILHCHPPLINPWWPAADGTSDCLSEGLTGRSCGEGSGWAKKEEEWGWGGTSSSSGGSGR